MSIASASSACTEDSSSSAIRRSCLETSGSKYPPTCLVERRDGRACGYAITLAYENDDPVPQITTVSLSADPGTDRTYAIGDTIEAAVTFSGPVDVDPGTGTVALALDVDEGTIAAICASATETIEVTCAGTVEEGRDAPGGIAVAANALTLSGDASVDAAATEVAARLTHTGLAADTGHRVDATRPAVIAGSFTAAALTVTFDEALDEDSVPTAPRGFATDAVLQRMTSERAENADGETLAATTSRTHRLRLILEGTGTVRRPSGDTLTPCLELGVRREGGDAETGAGLELGAGLGYASPGGRLGGGARARTLLAHDDEGYEEWGMSGTIELAPHPSGRGLGLKLGTTLGADGNAEGLWGHTDARGFADRDEDANVTESVRLDAEVGYGLGLGAPRAVATPYGRWSRSGESTTRTLGQRLDVGPSQWELATELGDTGRDWRASYTFAGAGTLGVEATRHSAEADNAIMLRAAMRW